MGKSKRRTYSAELERMIGRLTLKNDMLKKAKNWLE